MKKGFFLTGVMLLIMFMLNSFVFADSKEPETVDLKIGICNNIKLQIDSTKVTTNAIDTKLAAAPYIKNGFTMLPVRFVSESLGATVSWDPKAKEVTVSKGPILIKLTLDNNKASVNGVIKTLDVPAELKNGSTMIPLRFVSENLDSKLTWNKEDRSISIQSNTCTTIADETKTIVEDKKISIADEKKMIADIAKANTIYWTEGDIDNYMKTLAVNTEEAKAEYAKNMADTVNTHLIVFESIGEVNISGKNATAKMIRTHTVTQPDYNVKRHFREYIDVLLVKMADNTWKIHKLNLIKMEDLPEPTVTSSVS